MTPEEESELISLVRALPSGTGRHTYKLDRRTLNELRAKEGEVPYEAFDNPGTFPVSRDT